MNIPECPKIELHCHLDGSLGLGVAKKLLEDRGEKFTIEELKQQMEAPEDCRDLAEYLERFDLPNQVMQTEEELKAVAFDLARQAAEENVVYLESRFAPVFSTAEGLTVGKVLEAVAEGFRRAELKYGIRTGIIVCGMRGLSEKANLSMLAAAREFYGAGVVACDLAGDEKSYPVEQFAYFFEKAKEYGMPYTIHAGECGSKENIRRSIDFGAKRIGHGIAMWHDRELIKLCAGRRIGVEMCPTSNLQTKAIDRAGFARYPFREFFDAGVPVSVNTDNRTVSGVTLTHEYQMIAGTFLLNERDIKRLYMDSVETSFASEDVKQELISKWESFISHKEGEKSNVNGPE